MPLTLKPQFKKRIEHFFKKRQIHIDYDNAELLIENLYTQFEEQGRFKGKDKRFVVTPRFVLGAISNFFKIYPSLTLELFRDFREKRSSAKYDIPDLFRRISKPVSKGLITLLGRKHKPQYKLTKADGAALTPVSRVKTKARTSSFDVGFSPLRLVTQGKRARKQAVSSDSSSFELDMTSATMALWRKKTPNKSGFFSPQRITTSKPEVEHDSDIAKKLHFAFDPRSKKDTTESFDFIVTKEDILERIGAKRPISQKQVMGNVSAFEVMKAIGVIITEKQNGRNFHWAHRRGWSLKGEQVKGNFDPMTAGSNYDTLFKIEAPLKKLLLDDEVDEVYVHGEVKFDNHSGLPFKITYKLSWGTKGFIEVVIDPMSHRVPTVDEHEVAKSFFSLAVD
jgi:hypothetical protein